MEKHQGILNSKCRIGNCSLKDSPVYDKFNFKTKLLNLFGICLSDDVTSIHPPFICEKHKKVLMFARDALTKRTSYVTTTLPFTFLEHDNNGCQLCKSEISDSAPGRTKKRACQTGAEKQMNKTKK